MERDPLIQPSPSFQQLRLAGEHHEQPHKQLIRPPIARPVLAGERKKERKKEGGPACAKASLTVRLQGLFRSSPPPPARSPSTQFQPPSSPPPSYLPINDKPTPAEKHPPAACCHMGHRPHISCIVLSGFVPAAAAAAPLPHGGEAT